MTFCDDPPFGTYAPSARQRRILAWFRDTPLGGTRLRRGAIRAFQADSAGPLDATLFGLKVRFFPHDNSCDAKAAVCGRQFNAAELRWIGRALPKGGTFVDVGANMGFFSMFAAQRGANVLAIEPNPRLLPRLRANLARNQFRIRIFDCAVGEATGEHTLASGADLGGGHLAAAGDAGAICKIHVRPLIEIVEEAGLRQIDVLKIDIEGYEDRALLPFFETAPKALFPRHIVFEHSESRHWKADLIARLTALGYVTRGRSRGNSWVALAG